MTVQRYGKVNVPVNNAGIVIPRVPIGRFARVEEIVAGVIFSPQKSSYMTGSELVIDGSALAK